MRMRELTIFDGGGAIIDIHKGEEFRIIKTQFGEFKVSYPNGEEYIYNGLPYRLVERN